MKIFYLWSACIIFAILYLLSGNYEQSTTFVAAAFIIQAIGLEK